MTPEEKLQRKRKKARKEITRIYDKMPKWLRVYEYYKRVLDDFDSLYELAAKADKAKAFDYAHDANSALTMMRNLAVGYNRLVGASDKLRKVQERRRKIAEPLGIPHE